MQIRHFILLEGVCANCGKIGRGTVPEGFVVGYGERLTALIGELSGSQRCSRRSVKEFIESVLKIPISVGGIQRCVDRVSAAILPHYEAIAAKARSAEVNHLDETSWHQHGVLMWLWVMVNSTVAFFSVKTGRTKAAFEELIGHWAGILVSDNYRLYRNWVNLRQTCLAHLIRTAEGLSERKDEALSWFGWRARSELQRLIHWANAPPTKGEVSTWYARMRHLIDLYKARKDEAGRLARLLDAEMGSLWVFLLEEGVATPRTIARKEPFVSQCCGAE